MADNEESQTSVDNNDSKDNSSLDSDTSTPDTSNDVDTDKRENSNQESNEPVEDSGDSSSNKGMGFKNGLSNARTYNRAGGLNSLARNFDRGANRVGNASKRLGNASKKLENYSNKHQDTRRGSTANAVGKKMGAASEKLDGVSKKLSGANKKLQTANNINNIKNDPSVAKDIAVEVTKEAGKKQIKALAISAISTIGCLPFVVIFLVAICFLAVIGSVLIFDSDSNASEVATVSGTCSYNVNGKTVSNIKVRLLNCEGNTPVAGEELIDFETYITGVVYQENGDASYEALKTQAVAARSYSLTRPKSMNNAVGITLKEENGQWVLSLRSCTNDQAFCHPDKGCWSNTAGGDAHYPNTEQVAPVEERTIHSGYDASKPWQREPLPENNNIRKAVEETRGEVLVNSKGDIVNTNYNDDNQIRWNNSAKNGSKYFPILVKDYPSGKELYSNCVSENNAGNSANIDVASIKLTDNIDKIFKSNFDNFLQKNNTSREKYNEYIYNSVRNAGVSTRSGIAAAAISLIDYMANMGYKLQYTWGGSYEGYGVKDFGASGLDCSHFVSWAIHNGGFKYEYKQSGDWGNAGKKCKRTDSNCVGQVGDLIWHDGHIMLIVGVDGSNYYIAEAQGIKTGIILRKSPIHSSGNSKTDYIVDMTNYYANLQKASSYPK